jgi:hypothetical protein
MPEEEKRYRVLRVLEYEGTLDFLKASLAQRAVRGCMMTLNGSVREAVTHSDIWDAEKSNEAIEWL